MSYDLLLNLGLNIGRETNIILLNFKTYLINSIQKKFVYLSFSNFGLFKFVRFLNMLYATANTFT